MSCCASLNISLQVAGSSLRQAGLISGGYIYMGGGAEEGGMWGGCVPLPQR